VIETERLTLRPLSRADLDAWTRFMMDGDARAGLHTPEPATDPAQAEAALDRFVEIAEMYALIVRETGETAGFVGFVPRTMDWGDELELGWMLLPAHRGRGYATEAARAVMAWAFADGIHRLQATHMTRNPASGRVMQKLGMRHEGTLRAYFRRFDRFEDIEMYAKLATDP
jgi:RimJ/RimL family protein N-acetyltransferase